MKILVTGGAGFIGSHVADSYITAGHEVIIVDDLSSGSRRNVNPAATFHEIDMLSPEFEKLVAVAKPDVINHHAAQISVTHSIADPLDDARRNILGSLSVFDAARKNGVSKVINVSSGGAIYGEPESLPCDESQPINPEAPYGLSKYVVEQYLDLYRERFGLNFTTLRYANVYGPRQDPHGEAGVIAIFTDHMLEDEPCTIFGDGDQERDFVFVGDIARANVAALTMADGEALNIGTGVGTSVNQVFQALRNATDYGHDPVYAPAKPGEVYRTYLAIERARRLLDWQPTVGFVDGIERTVQSFQG